MAFDEPIQLSRPLRTFDGEGMSETLSNTPTTIWADIRINDNAQEIVVHLDEDIRIGDIIAVPLTRFNPFGG